MLNIYYGRESVDKEKFIYETIAGRGFGTASPVIVLVPDQYTLEAERQALSITKKDALIGLDVISLSRLEHNVIADLGNGGVQFIDKYGRQMLLTGVLAGLKDDLAVYAGSVRKSAFIEMLNDYISQLKQYDISPEILKEAASGLPEDDSLAIKMRDISKIYTAYDERIKGKYTDSEDFVELFLDRADRSELLRKAVIWVYGFDSFAPKSLKAIGKLMAVCPEVNVVLTYDEGTADEDLFSLTGRVRDNLISTAAGNGVKTGRIASISQMFPDGRYDISKASPEIAYLERELYSVIPHTLEKGSEHEMTGSSAEGITVIESANYYNEAESAAAYILHLIRDKRYRYRDIAVICNDADKRGAALEHAFGEYGLPAFVDKKRSISGSSIAVYITALITACTRGMRTQDIFRALKTGLGVLDQDKTERLEYYATCYRIDRNLWNREFTYQRNDISEEELEELENSRICITGLFRKLTALLRKKQNYSGFLKEFYQFLTEDALLTVKLNLLAEAQEQSGLHDLAEETVQVWDQIVSILDQIGAIMGEEPFDAEEFLNVFTVGLKQSEIGIMPTSPDDLMIGTMQRTRVGKIKAVVVVGANEGVIPQGGGGSGLFAEQEEERLAENGFEACKSSQVRREEERLAIYRNLSRPDSELWISYTSADDEGKTLRPSELIEDILNLFRYKKAGRDILNTDNTDDLIGGRISTLRHLADAKVKAKEGAKQDPVWDSVLGWYREHEPETARSIIEGLDFDNKADPIGDDLSDILFTGKQSDRVSPSGLEGYAQCPFGYFVGSGLRPEEWRIFETGSREIGDVYHESLMKIASDLTEQGIWDTVTPEQIKDMVRRTVEDERKKYNSGLLQYSSSDAYRAGRIEKTLEEIAEILVNHEKAGKIAESRYEQAFQRGSDLMPIETEAGGKKIYIEGRIDRLDTLENGRVKIIDYKSGNPTISGREIRAGYRLQLMLYMKAAQEGKREPAGVFYFYISPEDIDIDKLGDGASIVGETKPESITSKRAPSMRGIVVNDTETISEIVGDDAAGKIIPVLKNKKGTYYTRSNDALLPEGDFKDLQKAVDDKIQELVTGIEEGHIDIHPMRKNTEPIACRYCPYLSVCRFDTSFRSCRYNDI